MQVQLRYLFILISALIKTLRHNRDKSTHLRSGNISDVLYREGHSVRRAVQPERRGRADTLWAGFSRHPIRLQLNILVMSAFNCRDTQTRVIELGVTQPKAKLEPRFDVCRIKVAIVDEQAANIC